MSALPASRLSSSRLEEILAGLNPEQRTAVQAGDGPLLIFAGAGTGKTQVLTRRIAYLLADGSAQMHEICAVTFTNKAAREMRERVEGLIGQEPVGMWLGTFHSLGLRMLRTADHAEMVGLGPRFSIWDEGDARSALMRAADKVNFKFKDRGVKAGTVAHIISMAKDELLSPTELFEEAADERQEQIAAIYREYQRELRDGNAVDFDDLIALPCHLFRDHPETLAKYHQRYKYVLVDEYQDTSHAQFVLVSQLAKHLQNLTVVGDDDQAIYNWRGADVRNILSFRDLYPQAKVVKLEQNFRSHQLILDAAFGVIDNNVEREEKQLWSQVKTGEQIHVTNPFNEEEEAAFIADEVKNLVERGEPRTGQQYGYDQCAVLYRLNSQSRAFEREFNLRGIPYQLIGGTRFFDRAEIKDSLAYLRLLANPSDIASFMRAVGSPRRGIGDTSIDRVVAEARRAGVPVMEAIQSPAVIGLAPKSARKALEEFATLMEAYTRRAHSEPLDQVLDGLLTDCGYRKMLSQVDDGDKRLENIDELLGLCSEYAEMPAPEGLVAFLENEALVTDLDEAEAQRPGVNLITAHKSKGLEWPVVFLAGMEETVFPHYQRGDTPSEEHVAEERRLAYVGITRARERLYLTYCKSRHLFRDREDKVPARFLQEIPTRLLVRHDVPLAIRRQQQQRFQRSFSAAQGRSFR